MIIILIRHGERGMMSDALTPRGMQQAKVMAKCLSEPPWSLVSPILYSSPKERCIQTAEQLVTALRAKAQIHKLLDECRSHENSTAFFKRVSDFFIEVGAQHQNKTVVVVSHSDWLEAAAEELLHGRPAISWLQGSGHVVEIVSGKAEYRGKLP